MRRAAFAVAVVLAARQGAAQTEVRLTGDKVELHATAVPLSEVLDRLARQTGMKVTYDGPPPRGRVSVTLSGVTPAQAVISVLEGQGLNYALRMDPTATRVETLMLVAGGGASASAAPAAPTPPPRPEPGPRMIEREPEPPDTEDEAPSEVQAPQGEERRPGRFPGFPGPPSGPAVPLQLPTPPPAPVPGAAPSPAPPTPQD